MWSAACRTMFLTAAFSGTNCESQSTRNPQATFKRLPVADGFYFCAPSWVRRESGGGQQGASMRCLGKWSTGLKFRCATVEGCLIVAFVHPRRAPRIPCRVLATSLSCPSGLTMHSAARWTSGGSGGRPLRVVSRVCIDPHNPTMNNAVTIIRPEQWMMVRHRTRVRGALWSRLRRGRARRA